MARLCEAMQNKKAGKIVLWYIVSFLLLFGYEYSIGNSSSYNFIDSIKSAGLLSLIVAAAVSLFDLHDGIDYVLKVPKFMAMLIYMISGYSYDIARKIFDRKYIIVARPLGWDREDEERRLERLRAKASRLQNETEVLDEIYDLQMAKERQRNLAIDLERQKLEQLQELQRARYIHEHGEAPKEATLKAELLRQELEHRKRMNKLELELAQQPMRGAQRELPGSKDDDDDDIVF